MKTKILFINAINVTDKIATSLPPLGLAYLASSLRKEFGNENIQSKIADDSVERQIREFKPDIIGISSVSQNYNKAIDYAKTAKKFHLPVIIGGVHISALPSTLTEYMDVGVIGEGEMTITELLSHFRKNGSFDVNTLSEIRGIVFRRNGRIITTEKRQPVEPLDAIPLPDRDLCTAKEGAYMFTSRGCPYNCTFCSSCRFWGKVRFFSAEYVADEIKFLVEKYKVKEISFLDDIFVASKTRLKRIFELLKREDIIGKVKFTCNVRSNMVTEELVLLLKEMNVKSVGMGFESGLSKTLEYLKGDNISVEDHINALATFRKQGIEPYVSFIIGSPQESKEDILKTLSFIIKNRLYSFDLYVLTPLPGTPVWEYAKAKNLVSENMNWDSLNVNYESNSDKAIILSETLTREQIYKLFSLFIKTKKKIRKKIKAMEFLKHQISSIKSLTKLRL